MFHLIDWLITVYSSMLIKKSHLQTINIIGKKKVGNGPSQPTSAITGDNGKRTNSPNTIHSFICSLNLKHKKPCSIFISRVPPGTLIDILKLILTKLTR